MFKTVDIQDKLRRAARAAREMLYGMTIYEWVRSARRQRAQVESLFILVSFGDLVGLPILPPYYTIRLLPYLIPSLNGWKRSLLRERDWSDLSDLIEGIS